MSKTMDIDEFWMQRALRLAQRAGQAGEVPVGAILVVDDRAIARARNQKETLCSGLAHAECLAIHRASQKMKKWRLTGSTLYVTLEPCLMCAGAILQARIDRVVFGATDPKAGAVETLYSVLGDRRLNHRCEVKGGVLASESARLLTEFFRGRREQKTQSR
ncbi:MAG: tRNA-specific adenosine deaminase [Bdellovibrio sp.]|nr:MAG: tRNA-specific adenosine deaminase [Bdellovibrio sp.]